MRDVTAIAFGPVPSRRLGRSLGINNIPPKSPPASRPVRVLLTLYAPEEEPRWIESHVTPGNAVQSGKRRSS